MFISNGNGSGFTTVEAEEIRFHVESTNGVLLDPAGLFSSARLRRSTGEVEVAQFDNNAIYFDLSSSPIAVRSTETDTLSLRVDLSAQSGNVAFRLVLADTSSTSFVDVVTRNSIAAGTIGNTGYPLRSDVTHVLSSSMEGAFTNFPNPFAAGKESTKITYLIDQPSTVTMTLYTIWGDPVRKLMNEYVAQSGLHQNIEWDGRNGDGNIVNNGVYYLVLDIRGGNGVSRVFKRKVAVRR